MKDKDKDELKMLTLAYILLFFGDSNVVNYRGILNDIKLLRRKLDKKYGKETVDEFLFEVLELNG